MKLTENKPILNLFEQSNSELVAIILQQMLQGDYSLSCTLKDLIENAKDNPDNEDSKKITQLIHDFITKCEQGIKSNDSYSMTLRGFIYKAGFDGKVNYKEAIRLYTQAIELKNAAAMNHLAFMHFQGLVGDANYSEAIRLLEQAIELKNAVAMQNRAAMHFHGKGGEINYGEAIRLFMKASELGLFRALTFRASMHLFGQGGDVNYEEAFCLFEQAIKLGNVEALYSLANIYKDGLGCNINYAKSIFLLERAIRRGYTDALNRRQQMENVDNVEVANELLTLIWDDLLRGASFTPDTLDLLSKYCKTEIVKKISSSSLGTSLTFLRNLKANQNHPITQILGYKTEEFNQLIALAKSVGYQRAVFFQALRQENEHPLFNLPAHVFEYILTFTDCDMRYESPKP